MCTYVGKMACAWKGHWIQSALQRPPEYKSVLITGNDYPCPPPLSPESCKAFTNLRGTAPTWCDVWSRMPVLLLDICGPLTAPSSPRLGPSACRKPALWWGVDASRRKKAWVTRYLMPSGNRSCWRHFRLPSALPVLSCRRCLKNEYPAKVRKTLKKEREKEKRMP